MNKKVLIIGSGGREHAIAWKLAQSPEVGSVIVAPGNSGMNGAECWDLDLSLKGAQMREEFRRLAKKSMNEGVDLCVVGPDNALADGCVDVFTEVGVLTFGPTASAARIESSKSFSKKLMKEAGVPTADYYHETSEQSALDRLENLDWTRGGWVIKADGLALGKGVVVCDRLSDARDAVRRLISMSGELIIEERLYGEELSWMGICDGNQVALMDPVRDYKSLLDDQKGPNTGGMGSYSPVAKAQTKEFRERVRNEVFQPTLDAMNSAGAPYSGILYAGLMVDFSNQVPLIRVLEFNARFGDPETQALLPRMNGDLYVWLSTAAREGLYQMDSDVSFSSEAAVYVVATSEGYPDAPIKGRSISGPLSGLQLSTDEVDYFISGAKKENETWLTTGGRVLGSLGMDSTVKAARKLAYEKLRKISFEGMHFRNDIAKEEE